MTVTAKEYLSQVRKIDIMINYKQKQLDELQHTADSITANASSERVQNSGTQDRVGQIVAKIVDLQNEINRDIDRLVDVKREVMDVVDQLDPTCIELLTKRYFDFKTWEQIAAEMGYSYQWVCGIVNGRPGLHIQALGKVQKIIDKN